LSTIWNVLDKTSQLTIFEYSHCLGCIRYK
jgi:hypothetical protein